jgi:hypothetical protein
MAVWEPLSPHPDFFQWERMNKFIEPTTCGPVAAMGAIAGVVGRYLPFLSDRFDIHLDWMRNGRGGELGRFHSFGLTHVIGSHTDKSIIHPISG